MLSVGDSCELHWEDNYSIFTQLLISVVMAFVLFIVHVDKRCVCLYMHRHMHYAYVRIDTYINVKGILF